MFLKWIKKCRLCGNPNLSEVIDLGKMPNQGFFIYKNKPEPPKRLIPNRIVRCNSQKWEDGCGLVQNEVIVPPEILYSNYGYLSSISKTMTDHLKWLNTEIIKLKGNLWDQTVCDIGCNDGTFLSFYDKEVKKIGVDPSDVARSVNIHNCKVLNTCFPTYLRDRKDPKIDVFTAFACLYDMYNIREVFTSIDQNLTDHGIFVFEVAYLVDVIKNCAFDGMVPEHVSLFSLATLEVALKSCGLKIFRAEKTLTNSGSILVFVCKRGCVKFDNDKDLCNLHKLRLEEFDAELDEPATYIRFRERACQLARELKSQIIELKTAGKNTHILGASTKLNTILGYADIGPDLIDFAAERDERKWGGRLLNGIPMIPEEESRKTADVYLVGPYHFKNEILKRENNFIEKGGILLFPLPETVLVNKSNYDYHVEQSK